MTSNILFQAENAHLTRSGSELAFRDLNWQVRDGEFWAIVGSVGSGKTSLAEAIRAKLRLVDGQLTWPFIDQLRSSGRSINWPTEVIHLVSFKEESRAFSHSNHYYQQRFNFIEPEDDLSLGDFLRKDTQATDEQIVAVAGRFRLAEKLSLSLIKLSNGQTRRARLARAILRNPEWLILDEPFIGLDTASRESLNQTLIELVQSGHRVTLITRPDVIPEWVTHVVELDRGQIRWQGPRTEYHPPVRENSIHPVTPATTTGEPVIELTDVTVTHGGQRILDSLDWTVRTGERWALLGPNGSGKTTLLSLIAGDHPQVYGNDVKLFGRRRGTGESIWDIKKKLGLVSPEIHLYFSAPVTAHEAIATGFYDVMAYRKATPEQEAIIDEFLAAFELTELADRPFRRLSTGEQRLILFVRGLVKRPPLLILDEPFQGMDTKAVERARAWLDRELTPEQTLIFVSHLPEELPASVNQVFRIENGKRQ